MFKAKVADEKVNTTNTSVKDSAGGKLSGKTQTMATTKTHKRNESSAGKGSNAKTTVAGFFISQLKDLVTAIENTEPSYVRCLKPNIEKTKGLFQKEMILEQLRVCC